MPVSQPVLNTAGSGEMTTYEDGTTAEIVVGGTETGGDYAVIRYHVKPGGEPPMHTHSREDELVFVEEGEITAFVGDNQVDVGPGAFAALPRGLKHTIKVKGESAKLLLTVVPAGIERFFVPTEESHNDPATFGLEINE